MALSDPKSVTIGSAISLPRTGLSLNSGRFTSQDGQTELTVSHQLGRRQRRMVRLDHAKVAADPLISAQNIRYSMSVYTVVDTPVTGFTVAEQKVVVDALMGLLTDSSGADLTKILGGES